MRAGHFGALGLGALVAAFIIGLSNPVLIEGDSLGVKCGPAWGGSPTNATESGESACAPIRSERFVWSITLLAFGAGLLVCAAVSSRETPGARAAGRGPAVAPALDQPNVDVAPGAEVATVPGPDPQGLGAGDTHFTPPTPRNDSEREIIEAAQAGVSIEAIASIRQVPEAEVARILGLQPPPSQ